MPVPLSQYVEGSHAKGKPGFEVAPGTMSHVLDVTDGVQHGNHSFHHHSHVPLTSFAHQHIGRVARLEIEAMVGKHSHTLLELSYHRLEGRVMHISGLAIPLCHQPPLVERQPQLDTDNPTMVTKSLAANLPVTASFPIGVYKLDTVGVRYSHDGGVGHETVGPLLVGGEQAKEASALREVGELAAVVTFDPSVEGTVAHSFDGEEQSQSHNLRRVETGLAVLANVCHLVVHSAEELCDKIKGRRRVPPWAVVLSTTASSNPMFLSISN